MSGERPIIIKNLNRGGIADSKYAGIPDSVGMMVGLDIHSVPGIVKIHQALQKNSGSTITEAIGAAVAASDGNSYWFSKTSGKIWKRSSAGSWSLHDTTTVQSGNAGCLGAIEYGGYIYWATQNYVHRIAIRDTDNWDTKSVEDYFALNLDQPIIGGTGNEYTTPAAISEAATDLQTFIPREDTIIGIELYINDKGTGDVTVTVHDAANSVETSATIVNASLVNGTWNYFEFASAWNPEADTTYHFHVTSTVADCDIVTTVANDLEEVRTIIYTNSDANYHPMVIQNGNLYIGDRNFVHEIVTYRGDTQSTNFALDLPKPFLIRDIAQYETDLVIGTYVSETVHKARVFKWNGWSVSFSSDDEAEEIGVRAFIPSDNYLFAVCGTHGRLYFYNGKALELATNLPGDYSPTQYMDVNPNAVAIFDSIPIFGVSNGLGNPVNQGIWSFGSTNRSYPKILNLPFPISQRDGDDFALSDVTITAILAIGHTLYVAWEYDSTYGVDQLSATVKLDGAYIESRVVTNQRHLINNFTEILVNYVSLPGDATIDTYYQTNYSGSFTAIPADRTAKDAKRMAQVSKLNIEAAPFEVKIVFNAESTDANSMPIFESIYIMTS